jgi:DNA-binding response OmpR family regulator
MMQRRSPDPPATADPCRVLIVDDDPDYVDILRTQLERRGFTVATASGGAEAFERLQEQMPDVVLLDVMMPDISGFDVLQRIRDTPTTARLPVILISAKGDEDDMMQGYQYGADYYITKPCTPTQLLYGVGLVLGRNFVEPSESVPQAGTPRASSSRATG